MKIGKIVKAAIKYAPVIYPIVKKMINNKNSTSKIPTPKTSARK